MACTIGECFLVSNASGRLWWGKPVKKQVPISKKNKKAKNNLLALGSTAVLAVYLAGYFRTRSAALRFEGEAAVRRSSVSPAVIAATALVTPKPVPAAANPTPAPSKPPPPAALVAALPAPAPAPVPASNAVPSSPPSAATNGGVSATANATASTMASPAKPVDSKPAKWKDGKFSGWGSCRHGDIEATVEIKDGRIVSAVISDCRTRYSCDVIDMIIPQVVTRQSADVDTVSGATQSADAFYGAVMSALARAKPDPAKAM
jgi:uncharacterized protein with FMN-binding domain